MTNSPPPNTPPEPESDSRESAAAESSPRAWVSPIVTIGSILLVIGGGGLVGAYVFIYQNLSFWLETQLSQTLKRPVQVGPVENLSLRGIRVGPSSIPATDSDADTASLEAVDVNFNLWPLLTERTLPISITLVEPTVYIDQAEDGTWLDLDLEEGEPLPVYLDISLQIQAAEITALPHEVEQPLTLQVAGDGRYLQPENELRYDLEATVANAPVQISGETLLETGQSQVQARIQNLVLPELATLLPPDLAVQIKRGTLNADLDIDVPSFEEITQARLQGFVRLKDLEATTEQLTQPVTANLDLRFEGQQMQVEEAIAKVGEAVAQVSGQVDLAQGYNLRVETQSIDVAQLLDTIPVTSPLAVDGAAQVQLQVTGPLRKPVVRGTVATTKTTRLEKTEFAAITTDFVADLSQIILKDFQAIPVAGGKITAQGSVQTKLGEVLAAGKPVDAAAWPLAFNVDIELPTEAITAPYYRFPTEVSIGTFLGQGQVRGTPADPQALLKWQIPTASAPTVNDISGAGEVLLKDLTLLLRDTVVRTGEGDIQLSGISNLTEKTWQASLVADAITLDPFLAQLPLGQVQIKGPVTLQQGDVRLAGRLDTFAPETIQASADLVLAMDGGAIAARGFLTDGDLAASATATQINLAQLVPNLPVATALQRGQLNFSGPLEQLLAFGSTPSLSRFRASAQVQLTVNEGTVAIDSTLEEGRLAASAGAAQIGLTPLVPNLPASTALKQGRVELSGSLEELLASGETLDLSSFQGTVNAELALADGAVNATGQLNNNQWQTNIIASELDTAQISREFLTAEADSELALPNLNALLNFSGSLPSLLAAGTPTAVSVNTATVQLGEQRLNAEGNLLLADLTTAPDIARLNLDMVAHADFDTLPLTQLVNQFPLDPRFRPEELNVTGEADFRGQIRGQNLISAPTAPGNLAFAGNLQLQDFSVNDLVFDPVMTGPVKGAIGQEIALDLRGEQDVIAAALSPCTQEPCRAPYLPTAFEIRQGVDTDSPFIALGTRQGDRLIVDVENFALSTLRIAPATQFNIPGQVSGQVSGQLDLNLVTLETTGKVQIARPGVGKVGAEAFATDFSFQDDVARLTAGVLKLENSRYDFAGRLDVSSGEVDGRLTLEQGQVQDILTALNLSSFENITRFFTPLPEGEAADVQVASQGQPDTAVAIQLNEFFEAEQQVQQQAAQAREPGPPTQADIRGDLSAELTVDGTLSNPEIAVEIEGQNWEVRPQPAFPAIAESLGLVIEDTRIIPVRRVNLEASYEDGMATVPTAQVILGDAKLSLQGEASLEQIDAEVEVENLALDSVRNFFASPVDITGRLNAKASITGRPTNPQVDGEIAFVEGALNGQLLNLDVLGDFNYADARFQFRTTQPSDLQIEASAPLPPQPGVKDRATVDLKLGPQAIALIGPLTRGQLEWVDGQAAIQLSASARLGGDVQSILSSLAATGDVNLENAVLKAAALNEELTVDGQATLSADRIRVDRLEGQIDESQISITGVLPLFLPLSPNDSDVANPLTVAIDPGSLDVEGLYRGEIEGQAVVTGAAFSPVVSGEIRFPSGQVFVPESEEARTISPAYRRWFGDGADNGNESPIVPRLNDFRVVLGDRFRLRNSPFYKFRLTGDLTLNGPLTNLQALRGDGIIELRRGDVDFFSNTFTLVRTHDNIIEFVPDQSVLNPNLDIRLGTVISDPSNIPTQSSEGNEIRDNILRAGRAEAIDVTLGIKGSASRLLERESAACQFQRDPNRPVALQDSLAQEELNELEVCLLANAITRDQSDYLLLNLPIVSLTSSPPRSKGEIVSLLGGEFLALARQLEGSSGEELIEFGLVQFVAEPLFQDVIFEVNDTASSIGKNIGADAVRVFPLLEAIYKVGEEAFVGVSYDYTFNEGRVRYEMRF